MLCSAPGHLALELPYAACCGPHPVAASETHADPGLLPPPSLAGCGDCTDVPLVSVWPPESVQKAAEGVIQPGKPVTQGLLNQVEMAFRAYDPCFGCATHALPGQLPLTVNIYDDEGNLVQKLSRDESGRTVEE